MILAALFLIFSADAPAATANSPEASSDATQARVIPSVAAEATASDRWTRAAAESAAAGDAAGEWRAQLRIAELAIERGHTRQAQIALGRARTLADASGDARMRAATLGVAGRLANAEGDPERACDLLEQALEAAQKADEPAIVAAVANDLGLAEQARGRTNEARVAFEYATEAAQKAGLPDNDLAALAHLARLTASQGDAQSLRTLQRQITDRHQEGSANRTTASAWIVLGRAAMQMSSSAASPEERGEWRASARESLERAALQARALDDAGVEAAASTALGELELGEGHAEEAAVLARTAVRAAARADDPDLALAANALLGRALRAAGDRAGAISALERAASSLTERRAATSGRRHGLAGASGQLTSGADVRFELVDLILQRASESEGPAREADLRTALEIVEHSKVAELRDYFRDDCVDAWREKLERPDLVSPTAAIIYPIALEDRLEILVLNRGRIERFESGVATEALAEQAHALRRSVVNRTRKLYRAPARKLYDWLIRPIDAHLAARGVDTLVFVPGGALRTVPMSVLMDGDRHLVERYAIATIPALELTDPQPIARDELKILLGGISKARDGFSALPGVPAELESIRALHGGKVLLDEDFRQDVLIDALEETAFNIVHLATHAQFGGAASDSFLLAWDARIGMSALGESIGLFRFRDQPLDLLLLSACQTAEGDEQAALGLAGVAVKAGARSALATLWSVDDAATQRLIDQFYRALAEPGISRAEALRRAQRTLLDDSTTEHPGYWAPFLMIGSWL